MDLLFDQLFITTVMSSPPSLDYLLSSNKLGKLFEWQCKKSNDHNNDNNNYDENIKDSQKHSTKQYNSTQELLQSVIYNAYQWGSRVYGNYTEKSDWDYIFVIKDEFEVQVLDIKKPVEGL